MTEDQQRISTLEITTQATNTRVTRLAVDHCSRMDAIDKSLADMRDLEKPLSVARHVWRDAVKPTGGLVATVVKKMAPYAVTALVTLFLVGQLSIPGCPHVDPVPPIPTPGPGPIPPVPVVRSALYVNILHDQTTDTPAFAKLANSPTLRVALASAGHKVRVYDKAQDEYSAIGFAPFVLKAGGLPCIVFQRLDGTVASSVLFPADETAFLKAVQAAGGK